MSEGHAVVDALVAMLIVSLTIILSLRGVQQADLAARRAWELRQADTLLNTLMQDGARSFDVSAGASAPFSWTVETQRTGADQAVAVCRRVVTLVNQTSGRRYWASSMETCPAEAGG